MPRLNRTTVSRGRLLRRKLALEALESRQMLTGGPTYAFDFGTSTSPVAAGSAQVTELTAYDADIGYGWSTGTISSADRGGGTDATRDFNYTADGTFAVDLPDGRYQVAVTLGDLGPYAHDDQGVFLQGEQVDSVSTAAGETATRTYFADVAGGQLLVEFKDLGGADGNVVVDALTVLPQLPQTISGYVYEDSNDDGQKQPGEAGVAGSVVQLRDQTGTTVATSTTDVSGHYLFPVPDPSTPPVTQTRTVDFPLTVTNFNGSLLVPQFDPALGTLTSVEVTNNASVTSDFRAENHSASAGTVTGTFGGTVSVSGPSVQNSVTVAPYTQSFDTAPYDGVTDYGGASGRDFGDQTSSGSGTTTVTDPAGLTPYLGTGSVTFSVAGTASG